MTILEKRYLEYFSPLVQEFVRDVDALNHPNIDGCQSRFCPSSAKRMRSHLYEMVLIGQDTAYWGDLREFITAEKFRAGN